ncbi:MAG: anti-sigma factor [Blastocatellales bacterium]
MNCKEFSNLYSAQLDGYADDRDRVAIQEHLRECPGCRRRAAGLRTLMSDLRELDRPGGIPTMTGQIKMAMRKEAGLRERRARRRADWIDVWTTRIFSQGIGTIVSVAMVLLVSVGVHNPAYRALALAQAATEVMFDDRAGDEIRLKVLLLQPPPPPVLNPSGELLGFGASLSEDVDMMATVKVGRDGRAKVDRVLSSSQDRQLMNRFANVIQERASFVPPRQSRNTSAEAVVFFSTVNISG